ncbi:endolytic transglycosylase MltG [Streptococcus himalayensis]|uniref:Endolytic murein transglycosylase n=1 Tax=Streptococcus himalayensis TaxID=1888195 RepID=A0A917A699_9STRE|nr:endolytic transglycosylase MltG [Streptococcus himalayensis]GGE30053.1 aminodeoxychorismate lyase [Streptococcus himalayensis]
MSDNSQDTEKLSFKEQILRDLARAKGNELPEKPEEVGNLEEKLGIANFLHEAHSEATEEPKVSIAEGKEDWSEPIVTETAEFVAPETEEPIPSYQEKIEPKPAPVVDDKEYNTLKTPVSVSYKGDGAEITSNGIEVKEPIPTGALREPEAKPAEKSVSRMQRAAKETKQKRQNNIAKKIVGTVFALLTIAIIATGAFFAYYVHSALQPVDADSKEFVTVEIPAGSSTKEIGKILEKEGLIKNGQVFNFYAKFKNYAAFKSGFYNLRKSMDTDSIAKALQEGGTEEAVTPALAKLTIPEGYTIDQIAQAIGELKEVKDKVSAEAFLAKVQDDAFIAQAAGKYPTLLATLPTKENGVKYRLEGYLFPATYDIKEETTVESLIEEMLGAMDQTMSAYYEGLAAKNLTVNDVLTLASLVEKEGSTDQDRKDIAGVFYNRLNQGMPLQSNIAILYAQGKLGQKTTLAEDAGIDTNIDSPYNIYNQTGLMPGPVDSPSKAAIDATINQNKSDYLYFVADVTTGAVYFANTYEEHEKNVQEHVNSKLQQGQQ